MLSDDIWFMSLTVHIVDNRQDKQSCLIKIIMKSSHAFVMFRGTRRYAQGKQETLLKEGR